MVKVGNNGTRSDEGLGRGFGRHLNIASKQQAQPCKGLETRAETSLRRQADPRRCEDELCWGRRDWSRCPVWVGEAWPGITRLHTGLETKVSQAGVLHQDDATQAPVFWSRFDLFSAGPWSKGSEDEYARGEVPVRWRRAASREAGRRRTTPRSINRTRKRFDIMPRRKQFGD